MSVKISEPTYKRFVVGDVPRFDEAKNVFSRAIRGEFYPPSTAPQADTVAPHQGFFRYDPDRDAKPGYSRTDYALRWAGRTIDRTARRHLLGRETEPTSPPVEIDDPRRMTRLVKKTARWFGADLVGVALLNRDWIYSHRGDHSVAATRIGDVGEPIELPAYLTHVIVMAIEEDYRTTRRSLALETATDLGYSKMGIVTPMLARFIQELGYHALASGNDTGLSIPLAVDAGLGELGRNGLLITDRFGPRVRLCKVFTDLPLVPDAPVDLGVQAFCEICARCAESCPAGSVGDGERTADAGHPSINVNVLKWPVIPDPCYKFWLGQRAHCSNCIRVCPFNKPDTRFHMAVRSLVANLPQFNRLCKWSDDRLGYGKQILGDPDDEFF